MSRPAHIKNGVNYSGYNFGGGHTILNESGTELAQRSKLQFIGANVSDDAINDVTVVECEGGLDANIVAPVEVSPSIHAYKKGDQLIYNDKLYTITEGISVGDELLIDSFFEPKTWNGYTSPSGGSIWTDGENIYFSGGTVSKQYVLDKATSTWNPKTWNGLSSPSGELIWTDGENIYFSAYVNSRLNAQYVLDKSTSTWNEKIWNGFNELNGYNVWTDGENIYYSDPEGGTDGYQFVLDKSTSTWSEINWNYPRIYASQIWSDGENIYCSYNAIQLVFNKNDLTWSDLPSSLIIERGEDVWNDGVNTYYSRGTQQLVLDKSTLSWKTKEWSGLTNFSAYAIWSDGDNTYCSDDSTQYVLDKPNIVLSNPIVEQIDNIETNQQSIQNQLTDQTNVLGAKNLIPYPYSYTTTTFKGVTFTDNGDGTVTVNGKPTGNADFRLCQPSEKKIKLIRGEKYVLSGSPLVESESENHLQIYLNYALNGVGNYISTKANGSVTFVMPEYDEGTYQSIFIRAWNDAETITNITFYPMLRLASDPDDTYVPYAMTNRKLTENVQTLNTDVTTLKTNLKATYNSAEIPFKFGIDANGNYGYIKAGADSVTPFKSNDVVNFYAYRSADGGENSRQGIRPLPIPKFAKEVVIIFGRYKNNSGNWEEPTINYSIPTGVTFTYSRYQMPTSYSTHSSEHQQNFSFLCFRDTITNYTGNSTVTVDAYLNNASGVDGGLVVVFYR